MPVAYVVVSFRDFFFAVTIKTTGIIQYTKDTFLVLLRGPFVFFSLWPFVFFSLCISCLLKQGRRLTVPILDALSRLDLDAELVAEVRAFTKHFIRPSSCLATRELELFLHSKYFAKSDSCRPSQVLSSWSWKEVRAKAGFWNIWGVQWRAERSSLNAYCNSQKFQAQLVYLMQKHFVLLQ